MDAALKMISPRLGAGNRFQSPKDFAAASTAFATSSSFPAALRPYGLGTKLIFGLVVVWPAGMFNVGLVKVVDPVFTADMILVVPL